MKRKRLVMYSGGIGSWCAAMRAVALHGPENVRLLFTDTLIEDETLYAFMRDGAALMGAELVEIADGRTPFEVFVDKRFLGNSRTDPCSEILKRELSKRWVREHAPPDKWVIVFGVDYSEAHRFERLQARWAPHVVEAPMCDEPWLSKAEQLAWARRCGLTIPRLYELGFRHNNCGGGCVKAGQASWRLLLLSMPDRYDRWERQEQIIRHYLGKDVSMLKERRNGESVPLTLRALRGRIERNEACDLLDFGGCGCFGG